MLSSVNTATWALTAVLEYHSEMTLWIVIACITFFSSGCRRGNPLLHTVRSRKSKSAETVCHVKYTQCSVICTSSSSKNGCAAVQNMGSLIRVEFTDTQNRAWSFCALSLEKG